MWKAPTCHATAPPHPQLCSFLQAWRQVQVLLLLLLLRAAAKEGVQSQKGSLGLGIWLCISRFSLTSQTTYSVLGSIKPIQDGAYSASSFQLNT